MEEWQFNVLFWVGVGGAVLLLIGPEVGLEFDSSPLAVSGIGAILTYVLSQKKSLTKHDKNNDKDHLDSKEERDGSV